MGWCTDSFYRDIRVKKEQKEKSCIECKKYEVLIKEWCEKIEEALAKGSHFDTFTQIYYDKFCEATGRENKR